MFHKRCYKRQFEPLSFRRAGRRHGCLRVRTAMDWRNSRTSDSDRLAARSRRSVALRPIVCAVLAILGLLADRASGQAVFQDDFESPSTSWQVVGGDTP